MPQVTPATVLEFLAWLATSSNRAPGTVNAHHATLADPLLFGLGMVVPQSEFTLLLRGVRARRPHRPPPVEWSLHKILHYLSFEGVDVDVTLSPNKAVFLLALASGYRSSKLAALTRYPAYTFLVDDGLVASVMPSPAFIAKK